VQNFALSLCSDAAVLWDRKVGYPLHIPAAATTRNLYVSNSSSFYSLPFFLFRHVILLLLPSFAILLILLYSYLFLLLSSSGVHSLNSRAKQSVAKAHCLNSFYIVKIYTCWLISLFSINTLTHTHTHTQAQFLWNLKFRTFQKSSGLYASCPVFPWTLLRRFWPSEPQLMLSNGLRFVTFSCFFSMIKTYFYTFRKSAKIIE
jgi:hypothetical protein